MRHPIVNISQGETQFLWLDGMWFVHCQCLLSRSRSQLNQDNSWVQSLSPSMVSYTAPVSRLILIAFSYIKKGPQETTIGKITVFQKMFISPGFLSYSGVLIVASLVIIFYFAPK
jgi:hypothetical protein